MDVNFMAPVYAAGHNEEAEAVTAVYREEREESATGVYAAIVRWAVLIGVFLMPIFFLPWTTGILELNKQLLLMVVAGTGLVAWLLSLISTGRFSWRPSTFDKGVLAILGAMLVATIFSLSPFSSLFGMPGNLSSALVTLISATILYFLVVQTVEDGGAELAQVLGISLTITFVYGLLQILGAFALTFMPLTLSHAFNTIGSPDALGVVAAVSLPLLGARLSRTWTRYISMIGFAAALAILVVLNWWVLWVIAIAGMVGLIAAGSLMGSARENSSRFSIGRFVLPMTIIVLGVFLSVVHLNFAGIKNKLPIEISPSFDLSRDVTTSALKDSLITGYGPETFSLAFDRYGAKELADSQLSTAKFYAPNSEFFNMAAEGGLLMILALIALFFGFIQAIMYAMKNSRNSARNQRLTHAAWAMLIALGAAFFLYPFNISLLFLGYFALALVSLVVWGDRKRVFNVEDNALVSLSSSLGFIGGLILVLVGVYFGFSRYYADVNYAQALTAQDAQKAASHMVSAINWNGHSDAYYRSASQAALGLLSQDINKPADAADTQRQARIQNYMSSAINLAKSATDLEPREALNWDNLGGVYQNLLGLVDGVDKLAETAYLKAAELRPGDASYYNKIGNLYLAKASLYAQMARGSQNATEIVQQGKEALVMAETNFKKAIELSNNFGLAIYNLGVVYDQQGKLVDAIKQLERIAPFNSDQPNLLFELGLLYYRNGDKDKAFNAMQRVLVLSPDFANARWYLALIYEERKDIPNAIDQVQKILALESNKDNQTVLDKLSQLQTGQPSPDKGIDQKPL